MLNCQWHIDSVNIIESTSCNATNISGREYNGERYCPICGNPIEFIREQYERKCKWKHDETYNRAGVYHSSCGQGLELAGYSELEIPMFMKYCCWCGLKTEFSEDIMKRVEEYA